MDIQITNNLLTALRLETKSVVNSNVALLIDAISEEVNRGRAVAASKPAWVKQAVWNALN
jgi:hypothetical protein